MQRWMLSFDSPQRFSLAAPYANSFLRDLWIPFFPLLFPVPTEALPVTDILAAADLVFRFSAHDFFDCAAHSIFPPRSMDTFLFYRYRYLHRGKLFIVAAVDLFFFFFCFACIFFDCAAHGRAQNSSSPIFGYLFLPSLQYYLYRGGSPLNGHRSSGGSCLLILRGHL